MKNNQLYSRICLLFLAMGCFSACKKDKAKTEIPEEIISPQTGTRTQFTLDSIFLYARQVYLWKEALPSYAVFNPRVKYAAYSSDADAFKAELFDISQLKINPATNLPFENPVYAGNAKYSYLETGTGTGRMALAETLDNNTTGNPVRSTAIFSAGNSAVGYVALSSFPKLSAVQTYLQTAFAQIAAANPTSLIIDLRSNGGGYVETAEYVANLLAPASLNGKVMYSEQFNSLMQQGQAYILRHQPYLDASNKPVIRNGKAATMADVDFTESGNTYRFSKKGTLESVKNVYFIVSGNTASASELLINCLKPYFPVKLVGSRTYGKPIGFFGVTIDKYTIYLSSFRLKNAEGQSDYFDGIPVDLNVIPDGKYPLGDPNETCLSKTLALISNPATATKTATTKLAVTPQAQATKTASLQNEVVPFMIEHRLRLK